MMINWTISLFSLHVCRIGRVKIMRFSSLCQFVLGVSVAFSGNYYVFMVLRFLLAMVSGVSNYYRREVLVFFDSFSGQNEPPPGRLVAFFPGCL